MTRELLLLRHGKAEEFNPRGDFDRVLKNKGKRHAQRIAIWLATRELVPDHVLTSGAERALNTARKCCKSMGFPAQGIEVDDALYLASAQQLLERLHALPAEAVRVMLVGHNPGLEHLLQQLCTTPPAKPADHNLMPTATLARLAIPGPWDALQPGQARLLDLQRGADLPGTFPFPTPQGIEQRPRPAYYYSQSAVIPYRVHAGGLQILIVRSSGDKHWVVPKGITDPGMTPQQSALKEAREEAGIEGRIVGAPLGSYDHAKWGATASVQVFAMQVGEELPEHAWEEQHRGRRWVSPEVAAMLLKQPALAVMIDTLVRRHAAGACPA
jgi:phosphohistidine phosphatase